MVAALQQPAPRAASSPKHPPYEQMIIKAIVDLNDKKGSSRKAIAKYIDTTFSNLPHSHAALLAHHLRRLKKKGIVQMVKQSYKLPKIPPKSDAPKRGRGRPTKPKPGTAVPGLGATSEKGPGRPRKPKLAVVVPGLASASKRGPGRPRKDPTAVKKLSQKPRGRPRKIPLPVGTATSRPRGRPPKKQKADGSQTESVAGFAREVVEVTTATGPVAIIVPMTTPAETASPRPRGRPKKEIANGGESAAVTKVKKPRGRPRRDGMATPSTEKRPRGRPRKFPAAL